MRPGTSAKRVPSESSQLSKTRCESPMDNTFLTSSRTYTPYPLYKQKVRSLLKPPDYSRQPPNFLSVRETKTDFEKKEASMQVKLLKKTFNITREEFNKSTRKINMLNSEIIRVNNLEHVGQHDIESLERHYEDLISQENSMLDKIRDEYKNNIVNKHVRERLRQTLMHLELKNQYLQDQIRLKDFLIDSERRKKIKTLENKFTMVQAYKQTSRTVSLDLKDRTQDLNILEDDIKTREKIHELRKTRIKKYEEIAEAAAIEEGDLKSNSIRESLLVHELWANYLNWKLDKQTKKFFSVEEAFKNIKVATTISDPKVVVEKFLMKEDRLTLLMNALNEKRDLCEILKKKNQQFEKKTSNFLLIHKEGSYANIKKHRDKIERLVIKLANSKEKLSKVYTLAESLKSWAKKKILNLKPNWTHKGESLKELCTVLSLLLKDQIPKSNYFVTDL
jgi:hypothetical protein